MPSVEALDTLVHTVIYVLWALFILAFAVGAVCLARRPKPGRVPLRARYRRGRHHHPRLWTRVGAALADGWREYAEAQALLRGAQPWI